MNINRLLQISLFSFIFFISCKNETPSALSNTETTRLDTITSIDQNGGTVIKVVRLHLNDIETYIDTTLVIDYDTYDEKVEITEVTGPRQEIVSMEYIPKRY